MLFSTMKLDRLESSGYEVKCFDFKCLSLRNPVKAGIGWVQDRLLNPYAPDFWNADFRSKAVDLLLFKDNHSVDDWRMYALDLAAPVDVDAISVTVRHLMNDAMRLGPSNLDFSVFKNKTVNPNHLVALLVVSSSWSEKPIAWDSCIDVAKKALVRAGMDWEKELEGVC